MLSVDKFVIHTTKMEKTLKNQIIHKVMHIIHIVCGALWEKKMAENKTYVL